MCVDCFCFKTACVNRLIMDAKHSEYLTCRQGKHIDCDAVIRLSVAQFTASRRGQVCLQIPDRHFKLHTNSSFKKCVYEKKADYAKKSHNLLCVFYYGRSNNFLRYFLMLVIMIAYSVSRVKCNSSRILSTCALFEHKLTVSLYYKLQ